MDFYFLRTTLAERLRSARLALRQTQQQLAGDIFSPSYISAIECGRLTPSPQALAVLAERLGMSVAELAGVAEPGQSSLAEQPTALPHLPRRRPRLAEQAIRQRLAQAEQFIRQHHPAQALALLQASGAPPLDWPLSWHPCWYMLVGWALIYNNQPQEARPVLEQGLELLKRLLRRPRVARQALLREIGEWLRYFLGLSYCSSNQPIQALLCWRPALGAIADGSIRDPELMMLIYKGLGNSYQSLGAFTEAITFFTLARKRGQDVHDPRALGLIEWGLGLAHQRQGNWLQARRAFSQAARIFEQLEARPLAAQLRSMLGQVLIEMQHYDEAETVLRQALGAAARTSDPATHGMALANMAVVHIAHGKLEKAIRTVQDGLAILQKTSDQYLTGQLYLTLACAYEAQHDLASAEAALRSAITILSQTQNYGLIVRAHEQYGRFLADQGRFQEAYEQEKIAAQTTVSALVR